MKNLVMVVALFFVSPFPAPASGQEDAYTSVKLLKQDYRQASFVAVIRPETVLPDSTLTAMGNVFRTTARVIESFKGEAGPEKIVAFYTVFEDQPNAFYRAKERLVFLNKVFDAPHGRWILVERENSSREATSSTLAKMRTISRGEAKKSPSAR